MSKIKCANVPNDIEIFKNDMFGEIRVAGTSKEPLFCLADICKAVDLTNPSSVKSRLEPEDTQLIDLHALNGSLTMVGNSMATFVLQKGVDAIRRIIKSNYRKAQ